MWPAGIRSDEALPAEVDTRYLDWFEARYEPLALMLPPVAHGYEVPAYLNWFGAQNSSSELVIAMLKRWEQQYGAELVAHYGTLLQLQTHDPITDEAAARQLAWEQESLAPSTLAPPSVSQAEHARALLQTRRWLLHERP